MNVLILKFYFWVENFFLGNNYKMSKIFLKSEFRVEMKVG